MTASQTITPVGEHRRVPAGIKYISFWENSGYGEAARRYLLGLANSGTPLSWTPMVPGSAWGLGYEPFAERSVGDAQLDPLCNRSIDYDTVVVHTVPEYFPLWRTVEKGKRVFGYTAWETDTLPKHWPELLNGMDGVVVPSRWNREVFIRSGVSVPIYVLPHVAQSDDNSGIARNLGVEDKEFMFYSINTWTARKALFKTIEAYLRAFSADENVVLVIRTSRKNFIQSRNALLRLRQKMKPQTSEAAVESIVKQYSRPASIRMLCDELESDEIRALHSRGDCYVSLSRGEGWGLGGFDAAAAGNPVIMTGFGGQCDYLPEDSAYLVDYQLTSVDDFAGEPSYSSDQQWAEANIETASRYMREVYEDRSNAIAKGAQLKKFVHKNFSESKLTAKLLVNISRDVNERAYS